VNAPSTSSPGPARREVAGRGSLLRTTLFVLSVGIVLAGALLVPMPLVETAPGSVTDIPPLVEVGGDVTPIRGEIGLVTVRIDQPSLLETLRASLDGERSLEDPAEVIPPTLEHRTYIELQRQEFRRSFRVAAAVGLAAAGLDVGIATAPQVAGVLPGGPADGQLRVGDVVRRFQGTPVASTEELVALVRRVSVGDELALEVERGGERTEVVVRAGRVPGLEHPGMGISLQTLEEDIDLPVPVELVDQRGIGGPSAGMMVALTVHDLVSDEDLVAGRHVVGTGTIEGDGTVGRIGSIREKTWAAAAAGADLMLVPASQAADARAAAAGRIEVVGVETFDDAVAALRGDDATASVRPAPR
jgi:PDZ domain-containing protein